jgi:hypothetical protein
VIVAIGRERSQEAFRDFLCWCMLRQKLKYAPCFIPKTEKRKEVLKQEPLVMNEMDILRMLTSSIAYVSSLSMTRILHVSAKSIIWLSSMSIIFLIGKEILTLSPSLWERNIIFCKALTHSFALGILSALKWKCR